MEKKVGIEVRKIVNANEIIMINIYLLYTHRALFNSPLPPGMGSIFSNLLNNLYIVLAERGQGP